MKKVYLIGICGTAMGSLTAMFQERGYHVRGSDTNFYPPIGDFLKARQIEMDVGFEPKTIEEFQPDLVVIGNVVSRNNPQAQWVMERGLRHQSFPEALRDYFLVHHEPIVIMGTHGKTTTSSLVAHILIEAGRDPSVMIGGIVDCLKSNYRLGLGRDFVVEGDEYDSAFFAKVPKFFFYQPQRAILTSVEFDHGDIYASIDEITDAFRKGVELIPKDGLLVFCAEDSRVVSIASGAKCNRMSYAIDANGCEPTLGARILSTDRRGVCFELTGPEAAKSENPWFLPMSGRHNVLNAMATILIGQDRGIPFGTMKAALARYGGVKRRQEVIFETRDYIVIDDFAHHPTAVRETIAGIQSRYSEYDVWSVFEPRTNTSRTNRFYRDYIEAFSVAKHLVLAGVTKGSGYRKQGLPEEAPLNVSGVIRNVCSRGVDAVEIHGTEAIIDHLLRKCRKPAVFLLMSNGAFDGIYPKLIKRLQEEKR